MKSFQFPTVGKRPTSKKDLEEQRKKLEEQAAAAAFEEYVAVFQDNSNGAKGSSKVWIKAGTYDAGKRQEDTKDRGKLYKPTSRFETGSSSSKEPTSSSSSLSELDSRPDKPGSSKKRQGEKKKSNLEIFKEELKIIQEEREERHRLKRMLGLQEVIKLPPKPGDDLRASLSLELDDIRMIGGSGGGSGGAGSGSIDDGDPNTTNIYLGNLPTKISEQQLMETFGKYGPLASVKVMWPRTEEEKSRNRLSGFVAFMSRRDGERALKNLSGKEILGAEIKLGWGKAVPIPAYPVYIPPCMLELTMPPPLSGLPFNAQVDKRDSHRVKLPPPGTPYPTDPKGKEEFDKLLSAAVVKVVMPTDRQLLCLIHRMVEFVVREGPMFEAMIMNKEIGNPQFRFLFENQSPAHVYYRWKLFSILQGDSTTRWRTEDFRMFMNGSVWRPPKLNPFTQGMPDELIPEEEREIRVGSLSNAQRNRLERMLRKLTPDRHKVAEVMIFCIEHAESASDEISDCIKESLTIESTSLQKKIARLYVLSDVLHNCTAKGMNAFGYRKCFKSLLPGIFQSLRVSYEKHKAGGCKETELESFKQRVMGCFKAWDEVGVFSSEFLIRLQNVFLGLVRVQDEVGVDYNDPNKSPSGGGGSGRVVGEGVDKEEDDDDDEEVARAKLLDHKSKMFSSRVPKAQMPPQSAMKLVKALQSSGSPEISEELDGVPLFETGGRDDDDEVDRGSKNPSNASVNKFKPSKWEELDPEQVKAGAVTTTSKWDLFEEQKRKEEAELGKLQGRVREDVVVDDDEDIDGVPMEEDYVGDLGNNEGFNENLLESSSELKVSNVDEDLVEDDERRRAKLREVEMKVLAFQDELERRGVVGDGVDLVKEYREKLLRKINNEKGGGNSSSSVQQKKRGRKSRRSSSDSFSDDSEGGDDGSSQDESSSLDRHGHHAKQSSSSRSSRRRSSKRSSNSPPPPQDSRSSSSSQQQRHSQQSTRRHHHRGDRSRSREEASIRRNRSRSPRRYDSKDKDSSKRGSSSRRSRSPRGSSRR